MLSSNLGIDARCVQRSVLIAESMFTSGSAIINRFSDCRSMLVANYRFFNNEHIQLEHCLESLYGDCRIATEGRRVFIIQDTTEIEPALSALAWASKGNPEGIGPLTNKRHRGYFLHVALAVDADTMLPLGIASCRIWSRQEDMLNKHERNYQQLSIEKKESYRWIESAKDALMVCKEAQQCIFIGDRENDIYEFYDYMASKTKPSDLPPADYVIRLRSSRVGFVQQAVNEQVDESFDWDALSLAELPSSSPYHVFRELASAPACAHYTLTYRPQNKKKVTVAMEARAAKMVIQRPSGKKSGEKFHACWGVYARESCGQLDSTRTPIEWKLLTSLDVHQADKVLQVLLYYEHRWIIEQLFRLLKSEGLDLESSQLQSPAALHKLTTFALSTAVRQMQVVQSRHVDDDYQADGIFSQEEQEVAEQLIPHYEGKTAAQKNRYRPGTLKRYAWLIGRLGGWKGYASEAPPGPRTVQRGCKLFYQSVLSARFMKPPKIVPKDVCNG